MNTKEQELLKEQKIIEVQSLLQVKTFNKKMWNQLSWVHTPDEIRETEWFGFHIFGVPKSWNMVGIYQGQIVRGNSHGFYKTLFDEFTGDDAVYDYIRKNYKQLFSV